jgi:hypothetical protein
LLLVAVGLSCGGCPPGATAAQTVPGYPFAYAQAECAPWDGPAVAVMLTPAALDSAAAAPAGRFLSVTVWKGRSELSGQSFYWPAQPEPGHLARCDGGGSCESPKRGTVWFTGIGAGDTLRGALDIEFAGGVRIRGRFDARWLDRRVLCG